MAKQSPQRSKILIGTAGWSLPRAVQEQFGAGDSHLERYATRFPVAEINTTFYRPHKPATFERWAASVPERFRFCVKMPQAITHDQKLVDALPLVDTFLEEASRLGDKLACILVQLPPSLAFEQRVASRFFKALRARTKMSVVCEPRHASWFDAAADALFVRYAVGRVAADPAKVSAAAEHGGDLRTVYYRLHGSPRMYYSPYSDEYLQALATKLKRYAKTADQVWCIFDNTASGAAAQDALRLLELLSPA